MTRDTYLKNLFDSYNKGLISAEAYGAGVQNIDNFCEPEPDEPPAYEEYTKTLEDLWWEDHMYPEDGIRGKECVDRWW